MTYWWGNLMITKLELNAFKSFPERAIEFKPLTLLAGLNNSGKSSVIQALRMYCNVADGNSALLDGHGTVNDIRSKFSSPNQLVQITCHYSGNCESSLKLDNLSLVKPDKAPLYCYIGADRLGPQTSLPLLRSLGSLPQVGYKGEYVLDFLQHFENAIVPDALIHETAEGKTLFYVLNGWLNEISPGVDFSYQTNSKIDSAYAEIDGFRPANVGFGLSYTLPILVAILGMSAQAPAAGWEESWGDEWEQKKKDKGVLVILENPEAHLHPQGQTAMGKLIALAASCGVQIVVETHSDHLMDGIRIAVKEQKIAADQVAFQYFTKQTNEPSEVTSPRLHENGKLDFWPEGFFDQTLKNRAILARKG
jgi:predicted ATPase